MNSWMGTRYMEVESGQGAKSYRAFVRDNELTVAGAASLWVIMDEHQSTIDDGFFLVTMVCHGELAKDRPTTRHLTEYFLLMSVGGALGGLFNAMIAPQIFTGVAEDVTLRPGAQQNLPAEDLHRMDLVDVVGLFAHRLPGLAAAVGVDVAMR